MKVIQNRKSGDIYPTRSGQPLPPSSPVHYWMPFHTVPIHSNAHVRRAIFRLSWKRRYYGKLQENKTWFRKNLRSHSCNSRTIFFPGCILCSRIPGRGTPISCSDRAENTAVLENWVVEESSTEGYWVTYASSLRARSSARCSAKK